MKRFATILLALVMILSLAVPAFAAGTNTITVTGAKKGETYNIYKMLDLSLNEEKTAYTYTVAEGWNDFFKGTGAGAAYVEIDSKGHVTWIEAKKTAADMEEFAKAAAAYAAGKTVAAAPITPEADGDIIFNGLDNGYYLITSTLGTFAMVDTTPDKTDVTINEKNPADTITKEVKEDSTGKYGASNDAQIGDKVEFQSEITLNKGTRNVVVTDTMSNGLTYNKDAVIDGLTEGTDYNITESDNGFVITFTEAYLNALTATTELTLTYSATLNENAITEVPGIAEQTNKIVLTYGDKQTVEQTTTTTTHKFEIFKHATGSTKNLAGAKFQLKKGEDVVNLVKLDDNNYRVAMDGETENVVDTIITVAEGNIVIWGVDADNDYALVETEAPAGYNLLTAEVPVTVNADNATVANVENKTGSELPDTGGVGTTMFYLFGGIMVLAAVVLLVTKKRMTNVE